jgi:hypothetical protein
MSRMRSSSLCLSSALRPLLLLLPMLPEVIVIAPISVPPHLLLPALKAAPSLRWSLRPELLAELTSLSLLMALNKWSGPLDELYNRIYYYANLNLCMANYY